MRINNFWAVCPITEEKLDSRVVRITGFLVVVFLTAYFITGYPVFLLVVVTDYLVRVLPFFKVSPLSWLATQIGYWFTSPAGEVNKGSKIFAARLGFLCACVALIFHFLNPVTGYTVAGLLLLFAFLESALNFCVGCVIYYAMLRL
jgi:hypothetical protein